MSGKQNIKTPIADSFAEWERTATLEEKQGACDAANALAGAIRALRRSRKKRDKF
jgi:hypothetical protein